MEGAACAWHLTLLTTFLFSDKIGRFRSRVGWAIGPLDLIAGGIRLWLKSFLDWAPPIAPS